MGFTFSIHNQIHNYSKNQQFVQQFFRHKDKSKYGNVRSLFTCTLLVHVYKCHKLSMHDQNMVDNIRFPSKSHKIDLQKKVVYKAKINSLFTSYKYLQDLKTGFKSCKYQYSVNKLYLNPLNTPQAVFKLFKYYFSELQDLHA